MPTALRCAVFVRCAVIAMVRVMRGEVPRTRASVVDRLPAFGAE